MRWASCGVENPDGMELPQPSASLSAASPLRACAPTANGSTPRHLIAKFLTSPSGPEGQRKQVTVAPDVLEEQG
jgi:hypothetical protein